MVEFLLLFTYVAGVTALPWCLLRGCDLIGLQAWVAKLVAVFAILPATFALTYLPLFAGVFRTLSLAQVLFIIVVSLLALLWTLWVVDRVEQERDAAA